MASLVLRLLLIIHTTSHRVCSIQASVLFRTTHTARCLNLGLICLLHSTVCTLLGLYQKQMEKTICNYYNNNDYNMHCKFSQAKRLSDCTMRASLHYCGDSGSGSSCHTSLSFSFAFCALFAAFHSVTEATRSQTAKQGVSSKCGAAGSTTNRPPRARLAGRVTDRPADCQQGCLIGRPPC